MISSSNGRGTAHLLSNQAGLLAVAETPLDPDLLRVTGGDPAAIRLVLEVETYLGAVCLGIKAATGGARRPAAARKRSR